MIINLRKVKLTVFLAIFVTALFSIISNSNAFATTPVPKKDYSANLVTNYKFDETSGTTCTDSKGSYSGTFNGTTSVTENGETFRRFNGTSDFVSFTSKVIPLGKKSIKFQIKITTPPPSDSFYYILNNQTDVKATNGWMFRVYSVNGVDMTLQVFSLNNDGSWGNSITCDYPKDNAWHNILLTYDSGITTNNAKLYLDDLITPKAINSFKADTTASINLTIGKSYYNSGYFKGDLDNLEIYNDVLEYTVPTASLTLDPSTTDLLQGETTTLTPIFTPTDATNQSVNWTSSDESIASVSNGVVTASNSSTGTVTITATTTDGTNLSASCTVTVLPKSTNMAKLTITMTSGIDKQYDLSMDEVDKFIAWYDNRANGTGTSYYTFTKTLNIAPFIKIRQYVIFDKIVSFDVSEYTVQ